MSYHGRGYYDEGDVSPPGEHYSSRDRHREYQREWDRGKEAWDWDRDRPRRRSRSRSRSRDRRSSRREKKKRDWSSESGSSRSRSRSRERRRRSRSRSREHYKRDWERPHDDFKEREPEKNDTWKAAAPNCTIMVSNLPPHITENEIRANITSHGLIPKDIRLIRRKDTGASRGFAFVEFIRLPEAVRWMEINQGFLLLENQYQATLQYSISKDSYNEKMAKAAQDWFCIHCGEHNFKRREVCFKCQAPRSESELIGDVQKEISPYPTSTVLLRNMDALTTEDRVLSFLQNIPGVATLPIKSVRIGRDPLSNISRGVCYLDMNNTGDAMRLYAGLSEMGPLDIDGKEVALSYCKQANATMTAATMAAIAANASTPVGATAVAAAQWAVTNAQNKPHTAGSSGEANFTAEEIPKLAEYSASLYAKTPEEHASYLEYYRQYYTNQLQASSSKKHSIAPDLSKYVYDEKSGYYYDVSTNLYYDAKTQYFYNPQTQQFCYWDNDNNCFVPVSNDSKAAGQPPAEQKEEKKEKAEKQDKVTVAKKIAKDMEKWAKTLNQKKESTKVAAPAPAFEPVVERRKEPEPADKDSSLNEVLQVLQRKQLEEKKAQGASTLVAYGSDSDSDGLDDKKFAELLEGLIDWTKLACLLCKRQFNNRETLVKHQKMSDLHKQNLEAWKKQHMPKTYRDRAKERRLKFGDREDSPPRTKQDSSSRSRYEMEATSYEQPSPSGSTSTNLGSKLLQKMGWQEGQGLGKSNQGRTTIIEAERRSAQAGLGMKTYGVAGDDYRASVRKLAMMRFKELNEQN